MKIRFSRTGEDLDADYDLVRLSRAAYTVLADLIVLTRDSGVATPAGFAKLASQPRPLQMDVKPAGTRIHPPSGWNSLFQW